MQLIIDSSAIAEIYTVPASSSPAWCGKEIGHALLHDPESVTTKDLTRGLKELEAESTAYVICTALGMDTSDYSFGYVLGWSGGATEAIESIKESTGRIQKAVAAVLRNFEAETISAGAEQAAGIEVALVRGVPIRAIGERSMDPETILTLSGQLVEEQTQLQSEGDGTSSSDDLVKVNSFEPLRRDVLGGNLQRSSSMGFVVFDVAVESDQHLDV